MVVEKSNRAYGSAAEISGFSRSSDDAFGFGEEDRACDSGDAF